MMSTLEAIIIAIVEGLTEYLPISSTAHMGFTAALMGLPESDFLKFFQVSTQFGAILAVVVLYWRKFFNSSNFDFKLDHNKPFSFSNLNTNSLYVKLAFAVLPALVLGKLFDDKIEAVLGNQIAISSMLIFGGIILLFVDNWFKNPKIHDEKEISIKKSVIIGFWQCLAMMPGTSRSAASIIGGMTQGLTRKAAAEFSFFLAVPTMLAVTIYSIFIKSWGEHTETSIKGYKLIMQDGNFQLFIIGNIIAFVVALVAIKFFIKALTKYGFKIWGWYRIIIGIVLLIYFTKYPQKGKEVAYSEVGVVSLSNVKPNDE